MATNMPTLRASWPGWCFMATTNMATLRASWPGWCFMATNMATLRAS